MLNVILQNGEALEIVQMGDKEMKLVFSSPSGTEMIHHKIPKGAQWSLLPEEGWTATESVYILSGALSLQLPNEGETTLITGDSVTYSPIMDVYTFTAMEDSEFIYTTTQPVFHMYSRRTRELTEMSVSIEMKDGYTKDHCSRIREMSLEVGKNLGLSSTELFILSYGSFFHDLGKIMIPEHILFKPTKLTEQEYEAIKLHTVYGGAILRETQISYLVKAAEIVEQHHERYNGSGYPIGLTESEIHIGAAIVAVVDSFDAMTTNRIYQQARDPQVALDEIQRCRGTLYHPDVVDAFLTLMNDKLKEGGE